MSKTKNNGVISSLDAHVGRQITAFRAERRMTQSDLGKALGVTFQQIQKYERGANRVSAARLYNAACILEKNVGAFFEGYHSELNPPVDLSDPVIDECVQLLGAASLDSRLACRAMLRVMTAKVDRAED